MYSMPIVGTEARLYFPSENGENPRITGCVRTNGGSCAKTSDTTKRYFGTEHGSELEMTPGALNIKGGSKEPLNISIDDEIGVTITSPKKLTLAAEDEIIMKTPKSVKLKAESQIFVAKENSQSGFSLENEMHFKSNNVIKDGSCRDTYKAFKDEPEAGQKPPVEEEKSGFNWGGLLMAAAAAVAVVAAVATFGIGAAIVGAVAVACIGAICASSVAAAAAGVQSAMGALAISSCAAVCGAVLWDFSEQDDTNKYSWEDADKYINSRLLGICIGNKIYYNHEISNLPKEITYKKNGYTYTYMLDEHKQYFMGLEMPSGPDITLKDGRVISDKKYEYKLAYTDEPKLLIGMIQVSPGKTSVAGKAKGGSVKAENVKEGAADPKVIRDGAARAAEYSKNWDNASLNDVVKKYAPNSTPTTTASGKTIYTNSETGIQIVHDTKGNYFRIEDTNKVGKRRYLGLDGKDMSNKLENGKQIGRSKAEYEGVTHFNNID